MSLLYSRILCAHRRTPLYLHLQRFSANLSIGISTILFASASSTMALIAPIIIREIERIKYHRLIRENLRDTLNPFEIPQRDFVALYRMPQCLAFKLIDEIRPFSFETGDIPLEIQVLAVLNVLASGSYQMYAFFSS